MDGQRIEERKDRLEKWFLETPDTAIEEGRRLADKTLEVRDMPVSGTLSVDPTDGRVLTTAMDIEADATIVRAPSSGFWRPITAADRVADRGRAVPGLATRTSPPSGPDRR